MTRQRRLRGSLGATLCAFALVGVWFAIAAGTAAMAAAGALFASAGVLFVLASRQDVVAVGDRTVDWRQVDGAGTLLLAAALLVQSLSLSSPALGAVVAVGALSLGFLGSRTVIDGTQFDADLSRTRLLAVLLVVALSVLGGAVLALELV